MRAIIPLLSVILIYSCEKSRQGCQDLLASNYDFGAVMACDSCCVYPRVTIDFDYNWETQSYDSDSSYILVSRDTINIDYFDFAISNIRFITLNDTFRIIDSVDIGGKSFVDDFVLVRSNRSTTFSPGSTKFTGVIETIQLDVGLSSQIAALAGDDNIPDSNAQVVLDSMYNSQSGELGLIRSNVVVNQKEISLFVNHMLFSDVTFNVLKDIGAGENWVINLSLNLRQLFEGVDDLSTQSDIEGLMKENLISSINVE